MIEFAPQGTEARGRTRKPVKREKTWVHRLTTLRLRCLHCENGCSWLDTGPCLVDAVAEPRPGVIAYVCADCADALDGGR